MSTPIPPPPTEVAAAAAAAATVAPYEQVAQDPQLFMDTLHSLHKSLGTKLSVPIMGGKALDLHRLFVEVTSRGGLEKVIRNRQWKEIIGVFSFPSTITNASFVLRKYYISLLSPYEQVYYFRKPGPPPVQVEVATTPVEEQNVNTVQAPGSWTGSWVKGSIEGKFENGYIVSVSFGSEKLKGVLYHEPLESQKDGNDNSSKVPRRRRKRSQLAERDSSQPKSNRSGYNFFYSEHYAKLKALHSGQEKTISTHIAHLWSQLTEAEKEVYQEKAARDKQRYQSEMSEYAKPSTSQKQDGQTQE